MTGSLILFCLWVRGCHRALRFMPNKYITGARPMC